MQCFFKATERNLLLKYVLPRAAGALTLNRREWGKQRARRPSETRISHTSDRKSIPSQRLWAHFPYCRMQCCQRDARRAPKRNIYSSSDKEFGALRASYMVHYVIAHCLLFYGREINHTAKFYMKKYFSRVRQRYALFPEENAIDYSNNVRHDTFQNWNVLLLTNRTKNPVRRGTKKKNRGASTRNDRLQPTRNSGQVVDYGSPWGA